MSGVAREGGHGRPRAAEHDVESSGVACRVHGPCEPGTDLQCRFRQVIDEGAREVVGGTGELGDQVHLDIGQRPPTTRGAADRVETGEDLRGGQAVRGECEHPVVGRRVRVLPRSQQRHVVPVAGAQCDATDEAGGDIGPEGAPECLEVCVVQAQAPQIVAGDECRGGVGGASGHAPGDRYALVDLDGDP